MTISASIPNVDLISLRFGHMRGAMPPVGALSLMSALSREGITCQLTDTQFDLSMSPFALDALAAWIRASQAPVIAFSVFNDAIPMVVGALELLETELVDRRIFVGGPGVVGIAHKLLERVRAIEMVVVGEGETALPVAITDPRRAASIPGVFARSVSGQVTGFGTTPREDLDRLAPIEWSWSAARQYSVVPWSTMRGCPFECQFCEITAFLGRRVKAKSISGSLDDLERALDAIDTKNVYILDDTFTVNKRRVLQICRGLRQRNLDVRFDIFSRTDTIDMEMMEALAAAGCKRIFFGVDGGDNELLDRIAKGLNVEEAEQTIEAASRFFDVTASFIWGYPMETLEAFRSMLSLARRLHARQGPFSVWPQIHLLSPSAGTPLFDRFHEALTLDPRVELLPLGSRLSTHSFQSGYSRLLEVIGSDPVMAAPFYHYETPSFNEKWAEVNEFNRLLDQRVGAAVFDTMVSGEEVPCGM